MDCVLSSESYEALHDTYSQRVPTTKAVSLIRSKFCCRLAGPMLEWRKADQMWNAVRGENYDVPRRDEALLKPFAIAMHTSSLLCRLSSIISVASPPYIRRAGFAGAFHLSTNSTQLTT